MAPFSSQAINRFNPESQILHSVYSSYFHFDSDDYHMGIQLILHKILLYCSQTRISCSLLFSVNRFCGKFYDNSNCAQRNPLRESNTETWQCSCNNDKCNTAHGLHIKTTTAVLVVSMITADRKSVVQGKSVDLGGRRIIKKKKK